MYVVGKLADKMQIIMRPICSRSGKLARKPCLFVCIYVGLQYKTDTEKFVQSLASVRSPLTASVVFYQLVQRFNDRIQRFING